MNIKTCSCCKINKEYREFYKLKKTKDGYDHWCKICYKIKHAKYYKENKESYQKIAKRYRTKNANQIKVKNKAYYLNKKYKMTENEFNELYEKQKGKCKICNVSKATAVDHCHTTGKVRGLLCHPCNVGIGFLKDNLDILNSAITYLKENK